MNAFLLDTCVWLDYTLAERPGHDAAFRLVDTAYKNEYPLLIASHSLKDFWYLFWQSIKKQNMQDGAVSAEHASRIGKVFAWATTEHITEHATVVASGQGEAWLALKMRTTHDDYEDNLVVAAALRAKPQFLVTTDKNLITHSPVATATPEDVLAFLEVL